MRRRHLFLSFPVLALAAVPVACGGDDPSTNTDTEDSGADASAPAIDATTPDTGAQTDGDAQSAGDGGDNDSGPTFRVSGTATYDWVSANDDVTEGGVLLDYAHKAARPIRRAGVFAMEAGNVVAQTVTNDSGAFDLDVPTGHTITIRVAAATSATTNVADGIAPDHCAGASWDVKVVDNTHANAQYTLDDTTAHAAGATGITLNAPLVYTNNAYVTRTAAPFAIMDTIVTEMELVCQGSATVTLPSLFVQWSVNNVPSGTDATTGEIGTSHYTRDPATQQSELVILGKEDVDTDEYDDHVIAHEFGHYLEDRLFRSDSVGGSHGSGDVLDPRVAFGEGWGNALSGMTFNDPIYVDTSGVGQAQGSTIPVNVAPTDDDRGMYSETSVQYLLWSLFDNRHPGSGTIDRIYNIFANYQKTTPGLTSALTFAGYYNQIYGGAAESLQTLWGTSLATPFNALCTGACAGTGDTADVFDSDNDIGTAYVTRHYPETTGAAFTADFWRQSRLLVDGANAATDHDQTRFGGYAEAANKIGSQRAYRYVSTVAAPVTISVGTLGASACTNDVLDMNIALAGASVAFDQETTGATAGCPSATFTTTANTTYTVVVSGQTTELPSYVVTVARKQDAPFTVTSAVKGGVAVAEEVDMSIPIVVTPTKDVTHMTVSVRGLDGVSASSLAQKNVFLNRSRGAGIVQPTTARVARGAAGWIVVDVSAIVKGRRISASYPMPLRGKAAVVTPKTIGSLVSDASGKIESMKAVVR